MKQRRICRAWAVGDGNGPVKCELGGGTGSTMGFNSRFILDHWDEFEFICGDTESHDLNSGQEFQLLQIKIPDHLLEEVPKHLRRRLKDDNLLFDLVLKVDRKE